MYLLLLLQLKQLENKIMSDLEIRTNIFKAHPTKKGYLQLERQLSFKEVIEGFTTALKGINISSWDHSAHGGAEWISPHHEIALDSLWPDGRITISVYNGSNEGYMVRVNVEDESKDHQIIPMITAKFFDEDAAWYIGRKIDNAFHEGLFN
jgi:hypothetical protein